MRISGFILCLFLLLQSCDSSETPDLESSRTTAVEAWELINQADTLFEKGKDTPRFKEAKEIFREAWKLNQQVLKNTPPDSLKTKSYQQRTAISSKLFPIDSTIAFAHELEKLSLKMKDSSMLADAYYRLAFYYRIPGATNAVLKYGNKSLALAKRIKDTSTFYKASVTLANFLLNHGHYLEAEKKALSALPYAREDLQRIKLFNNLATASAGKYDYKEKIYWLQEAIKLLNKEEEDLDHDEKWKHEQQQSTAIRLILKNNLAMGYFRMEDEKEKALQILEEITAHPIYQQDPEVMSHKLRSDKARALNNLALVKADLGIAGSLPLYQEAKAIWIDLGNSSDLASLYLRMALYYKTDLVKARELARKSLELSRQNELVQEELAALKLLIEIDPQPKAYALKFQKLTDSIIRQNNVSSNNLTRYLYDIERTREENLQYESLAKEREIALQRSKTRSIALAVCLALFLAGGFQTYRLMNTRHRLRQSEEIRKTETRISKRIHDELANDLYNTMTFAQMNQLDKDHTKEQLLDTLEDLYKRTRNISRENASISLGEGFTDALSSLIAQYRNAQTNIMVKGLKDIAWSGVPDYKQESLYRCLQELLVNMNKHARATLVVVQFSQQGNKLFISYKDNGKGMTCTETPPTGGLQNIQSRLAQTGGHFKLESAKGKGVKVEMIYG